MKNSYDIIVKPLITEKSMMATEDKKYVFQVARDANKIEIKRAVEEIFGVNVLSVNTMNMIGKKKQVRIHAGYRAAWKKAIVRLTPNSKRIEFFEGMV